MIKEGQKTVKMLDIMGLITLYSIYCTSHILITRELAVADWPRVPGCDCTLGPLLRKRGPWSTDTITHDGVRY